MTDDSGRKTEQAKVRLGQISSQVSPSTSSNPQQPNTPKRRRQKATSSGPPADYSDILGQISKLQTFASTPVNTRRGYVRQKQAGKLWVRERVDRLFDKDSVREVGSVSGQVKWTVKKNEDGSESEDPETFTPSNNVQGFGLLGGRKGCFTADDYSIRAGHADGALWHKTTYMEKLALSLKLPIIKLVDGSSGGGSVTTIKQAGYSYVPPLNSFDVVVQQINAGIPNLAAVLGPAIGLGAARAVSCHFSVMAASVGSLFNAGPDVVKGATFEEDLSFADLGGADMHTRNGTIDNMALDEEDAFRQLRTVLQYLPDHGGKMPPATAIDDPTDRKDESLRTAIPRRKERMYNPRKIIRSVVDQGSFFEIGALWGTTVIVGLAKLAGKPVGLLANNCEVGAGALDAAGSQKLTKHLKFCDVFNLPVLQFVDVPGYAIGTVAERTATMRHGVNTVMAYYSTTMPLFSIILRKVYGVAGGAMLDSRDPRMRIAWPSGDWGSLPLQGGIEVGHRAELKKEYEEGEKAGGPEEGERRSKQMLERLYKDYTKLMNPVRTANAFGVEEIVDPAVTRPIVCQWIQRVYDELLPGRLLDRANGKIRPSFA